jgi:hypothetical protein
MSKVYIEGIYLEELFEWYENHINSSGGDGAGAICCDNHEEVADRFTKWWADKKGLDENGIQYIDRSSFNGDKKHKIDWGKKRFPHEKNSYERNGIKIVNFHDSNENYIFCNKEMDIGHGDIAFVIIGDCKFGWSGDRDFVAKAIKE